MHCALSLPLAVAATALALAPASAGAAVVRDGYVPVAGPRLAGDQVVYADAMPTDVGVGAQLRAAAASGAAPRAVQDFAPAGSGRLRAFPRLAASPARVALSLVSVSDAGTGEELRKLTQFFSGRPGEPLAPLSDACDLRAGAYASIVYEQDLDVSGDVVAHHGPGACRGQDGITATLTDFGGAEPANLSLPGNVARLHVAGPLALYAELREPRPGATEYVVYDTRARAVVRRMAAPGWTAADLREDGAVAFVSNAGSVRGVAVAEPSGELRRLPIADAGYYDARFAGDGLLVMRGRRFWTGADPTSTLELRELAGRRTRVVARGLDGELGAARFDAAGEQVTFVTRSCGGVRIHVRSLTDPALEAAAPRRCRARLLEGPRLSRSRRAIVFRASCRGLVHACYGRGGSATVRIDGRRRSITARGGGSPYPEAQRFVLRLNRLGRRLVARRDALRITLRFRLGEPLYLLDRPFLGGHVQVRRGTYVLDTDTARRRRR